MTACTYHLQDNLSGERCVREGGGEGKGRGGGKGGWGCGNFNSIIEHTPIVLGGGRGGGREGGERGGLR